MSPFPQVEQRRRRRPAWTTVFGLVVSVLAANAGAQPAVDHKDLPGQLFAEGIELKQKGKLDEGCSRLQDSFLLNRGFGTQMQLADCRAKLNLPGRAALDAGDILAHISGAILRAAGDEDRQRDLRKIEAEAKDLQDELTPRLESLPGLTIALSEEVKNSDTLVVSLDDVPLGPGRWNVKVPIDVGHHVLRVRAPHKKPAFVELDIVSGSYVQRIDRLEDEEPAPVRRLVVAAPTAAPAPSPSRAPTTPPPLVSGPLVSAREIGIGAGLAVATVGLALGLGYGIAFESPAATIHPSAQPSTARAPAPPTRSWPLRTAFLSPRPSASPRALSGSSPPVCSI